MTSITLMDSSALLAFLWGESGTDEVMAAFSRGGAMCTAANWSEVVAKVTSRGQDWSLAETALLGQGLMIIPVTTPDAVTAGLLWATYPFLSLGDRLCLAVGQRLQAIIITADRAWSEVSPQVRIIR